MIEGDKLEACRPGQLRPASLRPDWRMAGSLSSMEGERLASTEDDCPNDRARVPNVGQRAFQCLARIPAGGK